MYLPKEVIDRPRGRWNIIDPLLRSDQEMIISDLAERYRDQLESGHSKGHWRHLRSG
jgi:hypothetical protein